MTSSEEPRFAAYRGCDDIVGQDRGHEEKDRSGGLPDCEWMTSLAKRSQWNLVIKPASTEGEASA